MLAELASCSFETPRLLVREWHSLGSCDAAETQLAMVVAGMLTPAVTQALPESWQGEYSSERAERWIRDRDAEGVTLLATERAGGDPIALAIIGVEEEGHGESVAGASLRLGYLLAEASWGRGFATELVSGFVAWSRSHRVASISAGVEAGNAASIAVLEKNGFEHQPGAAVGPGELVYRLAL